MCCTLGIVGGTQCPASYLPKGDADRRANGADADRPAKGEAEGRRKAGDRKLRRVELMEAHVCSARDCIRRDRGRPLCVMQPMGYSAADCMQRSFRGKLPR